MVLTHWLQILAPMDTRTSAFGSNNGDQTLHICVVTETFPPEVNGVAMTLSRWVSGLKARGHYVSLVRPRQAKVDGEISANNQAVTLVPGLPLPGYSGLRLGLPSGRRLRETWRTCRPDVVYVATEGPLGRSALKIARHFSIPVLSGFHTNFHTYSSHYGLGWLNKLILGYLRHFHNQTAGTLVPTTELADRLRLSGFREVNVLGRGVDADLFNPQRRSLKLRRQWGLADDDLAVIYVGRLAAEKNISLLMDSFDAMQQVNPRLKLVMVGDGPLSDELKRRQHADIVFCGMKHGVELAQHYASCDIFLFPSETETFGNVTTEAMASGLAVIAFDYAAAHMHLVDDLSGCLIPVGEYQRFSETAGSLANSPAKIRVLARGARQAAEHLDWNHIVFQLEECLKQTREQTECVAGSRYEPNRNTANL